MHQQLHLLVTNAALNLLRGKLRSGEREDAEGLDYVHSILEMMSFDVQATTGGCGTNRHTDDSHSS